MNIEFVWFGKNPARRCKGGTPATPAPAAPPPSATVMEAQVARREAMVNAAKRKGMKSTVLAGAQMALAQGQPGAGTNKTLGGAQ